MLDDFLFGVFAVVLVTVIISAASFVLILPFSQLESRSFIKQFEQTVETISVVRAKGEMPEADMLIEANQHLADWKYYNSIPILELCITDRVDDLKPIE